MTTELFETFDFHAPPRDGNFAVMDDATGITLHVKLSGFKAANVSGSILPVFFSGAVSARGGKVGPFFSGGTIATDIGTPAMAIADPLVTDSETVGLAWYTGSIERPAQMAVSSFLERLYRSWGVGKLLLIGGSGGGFAALAMAGTLQELASALVWNPQTDIFKYDAHFVRAYLGDALGGLSADVLAGEDWSAISKSLLSQQGIDWHVLPQSSAAVPEQVLYLQNATDWHVRSHALPYLKASDWLEGPNGTHGDGPQRMMWLAPFGAGHAVPSRDVLSTALSLMVHERKDPGEVIDALIALPEFRHTDWATLPQRMDAIEIPASHISVSSKAIPRGVRADLRTLPFVETFGGVTADLYSIRDGAVVSSRGAQRIRRGVVTAPSDADPDEVRVDLRDGFGQRFYSRRVPVVRDHAAKVFILGSCVSRDPMALEGAPTLVDYVARTSLASALSKPPGRQPELVDTAAIPSKFQRRMVEVDFRKKLRQLISTQDFDVLLLDIIDERLAAVEVNGGLVTASPEASRGGFEHTAGRRIEWGSQEHKRLWLHGLRQLLQLVDPSRIIVNKVYWASHTTEGDPLPNQERIAEANRRLDAYYDFMRSEHLENWIEYPQDELVADPDHKWGISPFHYPQNAQERVLRFLN